MPDTSPASPSLLERLPGVVWFFAGMLIASVVVGMLLALAHSGTSEADVAPPPLTATDIPIATVTCPNEVSPKSLIHAAACGDTDTLTTLLKHGADPNQTDPRPEFAGRTALHHATQRGDEAQIAALLAAGAIPDLPDTQGNTPLHLLALDSAAAHPDYVARQLLDAGAHTEVHNINGRTPIQELEADHTRMLARQELVQALVRAADSVQRTEAEPVVAQAVVTQTAPVSAAAPDVSPAPAQTPDTAPLVSGSVLAAEDESLPADAPAPPEQPAIEAAPAETLTSAEATTEPAPPAGIDPAQSVRDALTDWTQAWAAKDMTAYFARYHDSFTPEGKLARQAWARQRQARIGDKPGKISIELRDIDITIDGEHASVRFTQHYRARNYRDTTRKQLELTRMGDRWQIVRERAIN